MSGAPIVILLWLIFIGTMWCIRQLPTNRKDWS